MSAEASAYGTLGLRPGASRAEVDEAYRRLIKRYHPDRTGGDGNRAAEINRAYTLLRGGRASMQPRRAMTVPVPPRRRPAGRRRAFWMIATVVLVAGAFGYSEDAPRGSARTVYDQAFHWPAAAEFQPVEPNAPAANFDEPLQTQVIDRAIADAVKFHSIGDMAATLEFSRSCHSSLRAEPSITWFDSCVAFDEATVTLSGSSPFESGPFNGSSVMARQMGAARVLSHDVLAADSRLNQIRSRVELALVPQLDEAAPVRP